MGFALFPLPSAVLGDFHDFTAPRNDRSVIGVPRSSSGYAARTLNLKDHECGGSEMIRQIATAIVALCLMPSLLFAQAAPNPTRLHFMVETMSATVHKSPSVGAAVIGKVARGRSLDVTRELGAWVKVMWPETPEGYGY